MKVGRRLALAGAAFGIALVALCWHWGGNAPEPVPVPPPAEVSAPPEPRSFPPKRDDTAGVSIEPAALPDDPPDRPWEAVRRHCPWPPLPSSWEVLGEPCLSAMEILDGDGWRRPLADALRTRRAVAAALDNPECRVALAEDWPGEIRPALREPCQAAAMIHLAQLQDRCVERRQTDWEGVYAESVARTNRISDSLEEYHRLVERDHEARAHLYWETHVCRAVPPEAFEWIEALPVPPGDPTASRRERPPITQAMDLYDAARRLGAEIPDWAMERLEYLVEVERRRANGTLTPTEGMM